MTLSEQHRVVDGRENVKLALFLLVSITDEELLEDRAWKKSKIRRTDGAELTRTRGEVHDHVEFGQVALELAQHVDGRGVHERHGREVQNYAPQQ